MNPRLTLSYLFVGAAPLVAQPTLEFGDAATGTVNFDWYLVTDLGTSTLPADGIGQTWDFSSATLELIGTTSLHASTGTPYAGTYPAANWVFEYVPSGLPTAYNYVTINSSGLELVSTGVPVDLTDYSTDAKRLIQFPLSYGGSFADTYAIGGGSPVDVTWTYSGYGNAITSEGTFTDLVKLWSDEGDVLLWNADPLVPVVIIDSDGSVMVYAPSGVDVSEASALNAVLTAWPVPATQVLNVTGGTRINEWAVHDAAGRVLLSGAAQNTAGLNVDVSTLPAGCYHLLVTSARGREAVSFVRE